MNKYATYAIKFFSIMKASTTYPYTLQMKNQLRMKKSILRNV